MGVHTDPRGALEPRPRDRSDHGEADPARPRDRPGSRAEPAPALEDVPAGALGGPHGLRSVHRRGAHAGRAPAVPGLLRDRAAVPPGDHRRDPSAAVRHVDGADGPQCDGPGRWLLATRPLSDARPRPARHAGLWRDPRGRGCPADPSPAEESQSQRVCRAVRPLYERGVSQSRRPPRVPHPVPWTHICAMPPGTAHTPRAPRSAFDTQASRDARSGCTAPRSRPRRRGRP